MLAAIRSKAKLLRVHLYPQPQRVPPPAVSAARRLRYALTVCRAEAGRTPAATSGMMKHATRANAAMALCLSERLCGPSTAAMHGAIRRCCAAASYASPPSWCR